MRARAPAPVCGRMRGRLGWASARLAWRTLATKAAGAIVQGVSAAYYSDEHPMAQRKHEPGPPIDLENMRRQGVCNLVAYCLNDACRNQAVIDVSSYPGDTLVPWFKTKVKCAKCGGRGHKIDVMPNWKEADPVQDWRGRAAMPGGEN
jgi:hypothetical protein